MIEISRSTVGETSTHATTLQHSHQCQCNCFVAIVEGPPGSEASISAGRGWPLVDSVGTSLPLWQGSMPCEPQGPPASAQGRAKGVVAVRGRQSHALAT